jgi:hypothetical protein
MISSSQTRSEMRDHQYFVACGGLTTKLQGKHRKHTIPDDVDENLLARLLAPASSSEPSGQDQVVIYYLSTSRHEVDIRTSQISIAAQTSQ